MTACGAQPSRTILWRYERRCCTKPPSGGAPSASANIQTEITKYTLELLVRVPDLDAFFRPC
jgi:hypothetical protein